MQAYPATLLLTYRIASKIPTQNQHQGPGGNSASSVLVQQPRPWSKLLNKSHTITCFPSLQPRKCQSQWGHIWHSPTLENFSKIVLVPFLLSPQSLIIPGRRPVDSSTLGDFSGKSILLLQRVVQGYHFLLCWELSTVPSFPALGVLGSTPPALQSSRSEHKEGSKCAIPQGGPRSSFSFLPFTSVPRASGVGEASPLMPV